MATIRELITRWGFDVDMSELDRMEKTQKQLRGNFVKLGAVATAALAGAIVPAANLETELRRSAAAAGKTGDEFTTVMDKLREKSQDVSDDLSLNATDVASGFFDVISAGFDPLTKKFDDFSNTAFKFAKVSGGELGGAIEQLNVTMTAFGIETDNAIVVADTFLKTNTLAETSVSQLAEAMILAGPVAAKQFGTDLKTTTALIAGFAKAGFKGLKGGESLKQVLLKMSGATGPAKEALDGLVQVADPLTGAFRDPIAILQEMKEKTDQMTESQRAMILTQIFGQETVGKVSALFGVGIKTVEGYRTALDNVAGATDLALDQQRGFEDATSGLWESMKNLARTIGSPLLGPLTDISKMLKEVVSGFRNIISENPKLNAFVSTVFGLTAGIVALGSAIGIALVSLKLMRLGWKKVGTEAVIAQAKMLLIPIGIVAAFAAMFLVFDDLVAFLQGSKSVIGDIFGELDEGGRTIAKTFAAGFGVVIAMMIGASGPMALLLLMIALGVVAIVAWARAWDDLKKVIGFATEDFALFSKEFAAWLLQFDDVKSLDAFIKKIQTLADLLTSSTLKEVGAFIGQAVQQGTLAPNPEGFVPLGRSIVPTPAFDVSGGGGSTTASIQFGDTIITGATNPEEVAAIVDQRNEQGARALADALEQ